MSVPKSEQKKSDIEFFKNAIKLRKAVKKEMNENFGLKIDANEVVRELYKMYGFYHAYNSDYTTFELAALRIDIKFSELTSANGIYITVMEEYVERRLHWDRAMCYCDELLQLLQEITEELPADSNRLMPIVRLIIIEKNLIKGVRKSDNRFLRNFK